MKLHLIVLNSIYIFSLTHFFMYFYNAPEYTTLLLLYSLNIFALSSAFKSMDK